MDRLRNYQQSDDAADDEQKFISLPYIKGTSETLKRIYLQHTRSSVHFTLKKLFRNIFQNQKILKFLAKIAMLPILVKQKDPSKLEQMSIKGQ